MTLDSQRFSLRAKHAMGADGRSVVIRSLALIAAGGGIGTATATLPTTATLALTALLLLVVSLVVVWKVLRSDQANPWLRATADEELVPATQQDRTSPWARPDRLLFFIGAALVIETSWRIGLTVSDACFLGSFAWCCFAVLRGRPTQRLPTLMAVGVCLFAIGGVASAIFSPSQGRSVYETARGVWVLFLWPWTAATVLRDRRDLKIVMGMWLLSGAIDGFAAFGQTTGLSSIAGPMAGNRATGFGGEPNGLGGAACTLLVPALAFAIKFPAKSRLLRVGQWLTVVLVAISLVTSGSVSGLAGGLLSLFVWSVFPNVRQSLRIALVVGLAVAFVASSVLGGSNSGTSPAHRVQQVFSPRSTSGTTGSAHEHLATIRHAWPRIRKDPIIGVGLDNTTTIVHSGVVATWLGAGILGLVGLLLMIGGALSLGWYAARSATEEEDRVIVWALVSAVVGFGVFFANQPLFFNQYGFVAMALLVAWSLRTVPARAVVPEAATITLGPEPAVA